MSAPDLLTVKDDTANEKETLSPTAGDDDGSAEHRKGAKSPAVAEQHKTSSTPDGDVSTVAEEFSGDAASFKKLGKNDVVSSVVLIDAIPSGEILVWFLAFTNDYILRFFGASFSWQLLGRGAPLVKIEGNRRFRTLIQERQTSYLGCTHHSEKETLAKEVLDIVAERHGRFWKRQEGKKDMWVPVDFGVAMEKVKQAFRDNGSKRKSSHQQGGTKEGSDKKQRNKNSPAEAEVIQSLTARASFPPQVSLLRNNAAAILSQNRDNLALLQRAQEAERHQLLLSQMTLMRQHSATRNPLMGFSSPSYTMDQLLLERQILSRQAAEQHILTQQLLVERQLAAQAALRSQFWGASAMHMGGYPDGFRLPVGGMPSQQSSTKDEDKKGRDESSSGRSISSKKG